MKRFYILLLIVGLLLVLFFIAIRETNHSTPSSSEISATNSAATLPLIGLTNSTPVSSTFGNTNVYSSSQITMPQAANALTATNIEQWKIFIPGLRMLDRFVDEKFGSESWVMEETNRENGVPILLQNEELKVIYTVRFIDIETYLKNGNIRRVEMHSPIMNIDETRELGLKLCDLLRVDSKDFLAWSDRVGNHWLDAPLFNTGNYQCGFGIHRTYDDDKPWYINFVIVNRER